MKAATIKVVVTMNKGNSPRELAMILPKSLINTLGSMPIALKKLYNTTDNAFKRLDAIPDSRGRKKGRKILYRMAERMIATANPRFASTVRAGRILSLVIRDITFSLNPSGMVMLDTVLSFSFNSLHDSSFPAHVRHFLQWA